MELTADLIEAFAGIYLSPRYDDARPTAEFHRKAWALYGSDVKSCLVIAPRDHAKSTALTFSYVLAEVLFRRSRYVILVGSTEEMAKEQLTNISEELHTNEDLVRDFKIKSFTCDSQTDIIVECVDGWKFRILCRGAEQRIRGRLWLGMRPDLLICDDMEDDEQVENIARRIKFRKWFFRACKQSLSKRGRIRVHGTVLHDDSLLSRLRKNRVWQHQFYKAHEAFDDFTNILWPERWTKEELLLKRQEFIDDNDAAGYSQEILNDPIDITTAFIRREDMLPMTDSDYSMNKVFAVGCDFAVSKSEMSNRTSFTVGGADTQGIVYIVDQHIGHWDTEEWMEELFTVYNQWHPEYMFVEDGVIWKAVEPTLNKEMRKRRLFLPIVAIMPVKDKATRGRAYQKRSRAKAMHYDKEASWYPGYETEILKFTGRKEDIADDAFDSTAILLKGLDSVADVEDDDFEDDEEIEMRRHNPQKFQGRNAVTGY